MKEWNCEKSYPIDTSCFNLNGSMAFDGCYYYFAAVCDNVVLKYNCCFELIDIIKTKRKYTSVCYDSKENVFWTTSPEELSSIYKLDSDFVEIDRICLNLCANISALSYCCCDDSLIAGIADSLYKINKHTEKYVKIFTFHDCLVTGILSVCPVMIVTLTTCKEQIVCLLNTYKHICCRFNVPKGYMAESMTFQPSEDASNLNFNVLLSKRGCYPYIAECKLRCADFHFSIDKCNYCLPNNCDKDCKCHECCDNDIIESVAKVETAISRILNAEGEKLKKVLSTTDDIDEILCVNRGVNQTIVNATHLEQILYDKLTALDCDCRDKCCDE